MGADEVDYLVVGHQSGDMAEALMIPRSLVGSVAGAASTADAGGVRVGLPAIDALSLRGGLLGEARAHWLSAARARDIRSTPLSDEQADLLTAVSESLARAADSQ